MSVPDLLAIYPTVVKIFLAWSKKVDHCNVSTPNNSKPFQSVSVWLYLALLVDLANKTQTQ